MIVRCKCGNKYEFKFYNAGMCIHCLRIRKKINSITRWKKWFNFGAYKKYAEEGDAWIFSQSDTPKLERQK